MLVLHLTIAGKKRLELARALAAQPKLLLLEVAGTLTPWRGRVTRLFPRLAERQRQRAGTLSGGEQQMVAIARGLMSDPEILIIDELSLGLAPVVVYQLLATLKRFKQAGLTILLVEQNVHLALALSDYAYVVAEGRIFTKGRPAELAAKPEIRRAYLGL
jgi:branched-chain amino acid transport system ATP-binding protein